MSTYSKGRGERTPERIDPLEETTVPYGDDPGPICGRKRPHPGNRDQGVVDGVQMTVLIEQEQYDALTEYMVAHRIISRSQAVRMLLGNALDQV